METAHQPSRLNIANILTVLRIAGVPLFGWLLLTQNGESVQFRVWSWVAFLLLMATDKIDGDLARKHNLVTNFGKLADPIADKALTGMAFVGLAIGLDDGLVVPVLHHADELSLTGFARRATQLADRARAGRLQPDDVRGGTFTLNNPGTLGSLFSTPIIVQPQVGILGVGAVEKRAIIVSNGHPLEPNMGDALVIKPMTTLGFSYDHRVLDGATADAFCAAVKKFLEGYK